MADGDNIFNFSDKFSFKSPFDNWLAKQEEDAQLDRNARLSSGDERESDEFEKANEVAEASNSSKTIFLTFDDGLQQGTEEVLNVLKKLGVKATFFLTGTHIKSYIEKVGREKGLNLLKRIYDSHLIGNHAYSHANDYYTNYYADGLKVGQNNDGSFIYRTVLEDFRKNDRVINEYLKQAGVNVEQNKQHIIARFPGRNTWYGPSFKDIDSDNSSDTTEEAKELFKNGYRLYGWDTEWEMDFEIAKLAQDMVQKLVDAGTLDWSDESQTHPFFDLYSKKYIKLDRVNETWQDVKDDIIDFAHQSSSQPFDDAAKRKGKVIILMHDRAFRYSKAKGSGNVHYNKLYYLVHSLQKLGFNFATMRKY